MIDQNYRRALSRDVEQAKAHLANVDDHMFDDDETALVDAWNEAQKAERVIGGLVRALRAAWNGGSAT